MADEDNDAFTLIRVEKATGKPQGEGASATDAGEEPAADGALEAESNKPSAEAEDDASADAQEAKAQDAAGKARQEKRSQYHETTKEDLQKPVPMNGMRKALIVVLFLVLIAFIVYYAVLK